MSTTIRFISTSTVRPTQTQPDLSPRVELTPWDLQLLLADHIQKGLLFHKPTPLPQNQLSGTALVSHLKSSLSLTLDIFYPLAGRLAMVQNDDTTTSFFVDCNSAGAQFVHAVAEGVSVADIVNPIYVPAIVDDFFLLNRVLNYESFSKSKPLLAVQITELVDGIFIGCTANHSVIDGTSFWDFFNTWSEISRTGKSMRPLPIFDRSPLSGIIDFPIRIPNFPHNEIPERLDISRLKQRVIHFPKDKISKLKAKANAEFGSNKISSLQVLLSQLWQSAIRNKRLPLDHEVYYRVLIGVRQRMNPPLSEQYVGNAILIGTASATVEELLKNGIGWVAWQLNRVIASQTAEQVKEFLVSWVKSPKWATVSRLVSDALLTGSSPRFNVYGNDFGWGKPIAVRSGVANKFDGKLTVYPGAEEGSIDFESCLLDETLQGMSEDPELLEAMAT